MGIKHKTVGTSLSQAEWEADDSHEITDSIWITGGTPTIILNETDHVPWQIMVGGDQIIIQRQGADQFVITVNTMYFKQSSLVNNQDSIVCIGATQSGSELRLKAGNVDHITIKSDGKIGIGTTDPATSAILELSATDKAFLLPRLTTTQRDALTATNGMVIYNTTNNRIEAYENGSWVDL